MADLTARVAEGAIWTYASFATGRGLVFAGAAIVARLLHPDDFGLFNMAAVAVNLLEGANDLGLRRGLIRCGSAVGATAVLPTAFALSLGTGAVLGTLLFAAAPLAARYYGDPRVTDLMRALSVYFVIACVGVVPDALLQHRLAFNRRFWSTVAGPAGRYLSAVPLAVLGFGAWSLAWGQLIGVCVEVLLLLILAGWLPRLSWSRSAARHLVHYASQVSLVEWIATFGLNLDYVLVGHFLGSTMLGLYTLAFKLPDTTIGAAGWVGSRVLLPIFVELEEHEHSLAPGCLQAVRLLTMVLAPLAAGLAVLTPQVVPVLFGDQWTDAVPVVQLLCVSACLSGVLQAVGAAFMAAGQPGRIVVAQMVWLAVLVPALFAAAQTSIVAVALAHVAGMVVYTAVKLALVPSTLRIRLVDIARAARPGLLATGLMIAVLVVVLRLAAGLAGWALLLIGATVAAASYSLALFLLVGRQPRHGSAERAQRLVVTMVLQSFFPRIGGAETNLQALVEPLRQVGVDVDVVTRRFPGMPSSGQVAGARVRRLPAPGGQIRASLTFTAWATWRLARARPTPDVIHAHELRSPVLAAVCGKYLIRRPVVAHVLRGGLLGDVRVLRAAPLGPARLWLFRRAVDRFVAPSRETHAELLAMGVPAERIVAIPYGVDTRRFCPPTAGRRAHLRRQLGLEHGKVVVVVARLVPEKGIDHLLAAWPAVSAHLPAALLTIVGDGSQRTALECQAASLAGVRFVGEVRDPLPYFQAADAFTLPSFTEGQPISLLEAMSTGLVCVATDIGGIADAIEDGRTGVLVPPGDVGRLAAALIAVLRLGDGERTVLGAQARRAIVEHHSLEANATALRSLYERLL